MSLLIFVDNSISNNLIQSLYQLYLSWYKHPANSIYTIRLPYCSMVAISPKASQHLKLQHSNLNIDFSRKKAGIKQDQAFNALIRHFWKAQFETSIEVNPTYLKR